jgi:hypothetical protein
MCVCVFVRKKIRRRKISLFADAEQMESEREREKVATHFFLLRQVYVVIVKFFGNIFFFFTFQNSFLT